MLPRETKTFWSTYKVTQPMNTIAWAWTSGGEWKLDRPIASWSEKPAATNRAMTIAALRKKRSSESAGSGATGVPAARVAILRDLPPESSDLGSQAQWKARASLCG